MLMLLVSAWMCLLAKTAATSGHQGQLHSFITDDDDKDRQPRPLDLHFFFFSPKNFP